MEEALELEWGQKPLLIREGGTIPAVRWLERFFDAVAMNLPMGQVRLRRFVALLLLLDLYMYCRLLMLLI
jgi:hypothetical protein